MFEAENQAAVSGACGLKIQVCLDDPVDQVMTSSDSLSTVPTPLFFSICTEGPTHALCVHFTVIEKGARKFNMTSLDSYNTVKLKHLDEFLTSVHNVCTWGLGSYFDSVVERLGKVVKAAGGATAP